MRTENLINRILFVFTFTLLLTATATGQQIRGVVQDQAGIPLSGIHITLEKTKITAVSGADGTFMIQVREVQESSAFWNESVQTGRTSGERVIGEDTNRSETTEDQNKRRVGESVAKSIQESGGEKSGEISEEIIFLASGIGYKSARVPVSYPPREEPVIIVLEAEIYQSPTVVVTATRTSRYLEEVSIPVQVVTGSEIDQSGSVRISDVLAEQSGLQLISDHGTGVQIQGFDPDYTLIMIDGKPLIGRTAGTLDLTRVSVRNVKQIEIVKGPSSALWGSEALAGVVNIITTRGYEPFSGGVTTRYSRFNTLDTGADLSVDIGGWRSDLFINHNRSGGYSLNPNSISQTVPEYGRTTLSYRAGVGLSDRVELEGSVRFMSEQQHNQFIPVGESGSPAPGDDSRQQILNSDESQQEFMADLSVTVNPLDRLDLDLDLLTSYYRARSDFISDSGLENQNPGDLAELYAGTDFRQQYHKPELKAGYRWTGQHHTLGGGGVILEKLDSERYAGQPNFSTRFLFLQHTWNPAEPLELTGGFQVRCP